MNSWAKLTADRCSYYQRSVADGKEAYYAGGGESPGRYLGEAARLLGLDGELGAGDLAALTHGLHPATGQQVTARAPREPYTDSNGRRHEPVLAYDVTMSAPKSVSLLYAAGGPQGAVLRDCHEQAVAAAVTALERKAAIVRRGHRGVDRHTPDGLIACAFTHRTSRAGDPQLHTHVVIPSMAPGPDGRWTNLHGPALRDFTHASGAIYRAELRANVTEALGLEWRPLDDRGLTELEGLDRSLLAWFSTRRAEIERAAGHRTDSPRAMEAAALKTRVQKREVDWPALGEYVRTNIGERRIQALTDSTPRGEPVEPRPVDHELLAGPEGLTEMANTFRERDVIEAVANNCQQGARVDWILAESDRHIQARDVIHIAGDTYTTQNLVDAERARETAQLGRVGERTGVQPLADVRDAARRFSLNDEQTRVVEHVFTSGNGVEIVRARAGVGKTHTAAAMAAIASRRGRRTIGVAPTARATAEMRQAGIGEAYTLDALLIKLGRDQLRLDASDLIVFDEAPMSGTRPAARLEQHAARAGCKVIEMGDDHQLPSVLAGGQRQHVHERLGGLTLERVMRQRDPDEIRALGALYAGHAARYVDWAEQHGRLRFDSSDRAAVDLYREAVDRVGFERAALIAPTNEIADRLGRLVHDDRAARGELGEQTTIGELTLARGDRVICKRNDPDLRVINSDRATVTGFHAGGVRIALDRDGASRDVPGSYVEDGNLRLGYAATCHASQGMTVEAAVVTGYADQMYLEWGNTAFSRARAETHVCVLDGRGRDAELAEYTPTSPDRQQDDRAVLAQTLAQSRGPSLAIDALDRALERGQERGRSIDDGYGLGR